MGKVTATYDLAVHCEPFASFSPLGKESDFIWEENRTFQFSLKLFCIIPFGTHTIHVVKFDRANYEVYTSEVNTNVPVWNHKILLKKIDNDTTEYMDEVELCAGWKTPLVYFWAKLFYAH